MRRQDRGVGDQPAAVVVKHNNPTGVATSETQAQAYTTAFDVDPLTLTPGEHTIKVGGNPRYEEWEQRVDVKEGSVEAVQANLQVIEVYLGR